MPIPRAAAACLLTLAAAGLAPAASAAARIESWAAGRAPASLAVDAAAGRVFVANAGASPGLTVLDREGRATFLATGEAVSQVVASAAARRALAIHPATHQATLVDSITLRVRTVLTGMNPVRALVVERTGLAYVVGRGPADGTIAGTITEVELASGIARTYPVPEIVPEHLAADPSGARIYVAGTMRQRAAEFQPGYVQAFDVATKAMTGLPVPLGRVPRQAFAAGGELFVLGHVDRARVDGSPQARGLVPALFTLEASSLELRHTLLLPEAAEAGARGAPWQGRAEADPATGMVYALDGARMLVLDGVAGEARAVELESPGLALAVDSASQRVLVSLASGALAVFSLAGERLDTLPLTRPASPAEAAAGSELAIDAASGAAYASNAHAQSVSVVRGLARGAPGPVVAFTDLWVDPARPGWGVFLDQQGATLFATLFTHDAAGQPAWLFMSNGARQPDGAFAGDLYRTRGPLAEAVKNAAPVGSLRFIPGAGDAGTLVYYVDGSLETRNLRRFRSPEARRECRWGVDARRALDERTDFTSLWSNPADPGWGLALAHQGDAAFAVLFTYDEANRATWMVMSNGRRNAAGAFAGDVYRAAAGRIERAGHMSIAFGGADRGVLRYRISGLDFRSTVLRQTFSRLTASCSHRGQTPGSDPGV